MIKRLLAIGIIFGCVSAAWMVLAGITYARTHTADAGLRSQVQQLWGAPQVQQPPVVTAIRRFQKKVESVEDGKKIMRLVDEQTQETLLPETSDVTVALALDPRQKGLLWYATYGVTFTAEYELVNRAAAARELEIALLFPSARAVFDDVRFEVVGREWATMPRPGKDQITGNLALEPGERVTLRVGYRSQGLDRWTYAFGAGVTEVKNFHLAMRTDFVAVDFPEDAISPTRKERVNVGWLLTWEFKHLVAGVNISMLMPAKLQPGPLASQIATFAPVSLFFFIVVLLTIGVVKGIELHPMHFFFLAGAFFAFHLLFAYLADQLDIRVAFAIAASVSLALTVSYLRIAFGSRFAFLAAGTAQLVYLVLFSYAFFFKGLTGLAITIGAIATLFVLMRATARVDWRGVFAAPSDRVVAGLS